MFPPICFSSAVVAASYQFTFLNCVIKCLFGASTVSLPHRLRKRLFAFLQEELSNPTFLSSQLEGKLSVSKEGQLQGMQAHSSCLSQTTPCQVCAATLLSSSQDDTVQFMSAMMSSENTAVSLELSVPPPYSGDVHSSWSEHDTSEAQR